MTNPNADAPRTGTDEATAPSGPALGLLSSPSTWAGLWVLAALAALALMRRSLGRLG